MTQTPVLIPWAPGAQYTKVICRLGEPRPDGSDVGEYPDLMTQGGTVTITCAAKKIRYSEADGGARMLTTRPWTFKIRPSDGELYNPESDVVGVYILSGNSAGLDPARFTWSATVTPDNGEAWTTTIPANAGGTFDLVSNAEVDAPSPGESTLAQRVTILEDTAKWDRGVLPVTTDLNSITSPGLYSVPTSTGKTNMPVGAHGTLEVIPYNRTAILQRFTSAEFTSRSYVRRYTGSTWDSWRPTSFYGGVLPAGTDLNAATEIATYNIQSTSHPNQPQAITGALEVLQASGALIQRFTANTSRPVVYVRRYNGTIWTDWRSGSWDRALMSATTDVNTVMQLGAYGVQYTSQPNLPVARVGVLEVLPVSGTVLQRFTSGDATPLIYHRRWTGSVWTDWVPTPGPSEINDITTRVSTLEQSADHSAPVRAELGAWTPISTTKNQAQIVTTYTRDRLVGLNGGDSSGSLRETRDNGATWTLLNQFASPFGWVKQLENGELLVITGVDPSAREVWLSTGYDKGGTVAWNKVLTASGPYISFTRAWSVSTYRNIVLLAEYGAKLPTWQGQNITAFARYVYMSLDYGKTWSTVFDLQDYLLNDRGVASVNDQHLHGVAWDPYWDRIWVTFGDTTNGTVYSDDLGATWQTADWGPLYSSPHQNVGILPMPKCVLFGTDGHPNGVQRISRAAGKHSGTYTIEQAYTVPGDLGSLTHLCQAILKVDREGGDGPALFGFGAETQAAKSFIVGTYDGYDFKLLWMDPEAQPAGRGIRSIAGPNLKGELIVGHNDGRVANMWTELVGNAPIY